MSGARSEVRKRLLDNAPAHLFRPAMMRDHPDLSVAPAEESAHRPTDDPDQHRQLGDERFLPRERRTDPGDHASWRAETGERAHYRVNVFELHCEPRSFMTYCLSLLCRQG